uniref:Parathyroid hormone n=1 Tax=Periophthalmus magnuspinnatus TaxID=409849 RepID=A0A3B4BAL9_9GOBI
MLNVDCKILLLPLMIILSTVCEGHSLSKRTVSEVQLMHNRGEHKLQKERRDWLQMRLRGIHLGQSWSRAEPAWNREDESRPRRKKMLPKDLPDSLTPDEIQFAMDYLEEILRSKKQ